MALPATYHLTAYRGDSWKQIFRFRYEDTPVNLTGMVIQSEVRLPPVTSSLIVEMVNPTDGRLSVSLPPGGLPPGIYDYDIEVNAAGVITTWVRGKLTIERDVTNEP